LYFGSPLFDLYRQSAIQLLANKGIQDPKRAYEARRKDLVLRFGGDEPPNAAILQSFNIGVDSWITAKNSSVQNPEIYVAEDQTLVELFEQLKPYYKFAVVTGNTRFQAERILEKLSILSFLEGALISLDDGLQIKPDGDLYWLISQKTNISLRNSVVIGNSPSLDLGPAKVLGMRTKLIRNQLDLYNYLREKARESLLAFSDG